MSEVKKADVKTVLVRARTLLEKPGKWTKDTYARDAKGRNISPLSPLARSFCLMGALERQCDGREMRKSAGAFRYAKHLLEKQCGGPVHTWNDHPNRTHAEVLALLDKAIAAAS